MDPSTGNKQPSNDSVKSSSTDTTEKSVEISTDDSPILRLPQELLSAIIDYVPKTQWPSLELMNRSFRDAVYSSWQSMKEFDIGKDVLGIRQSVKGVRLSGILPSILAKLLIRSPMLQSISGFPPKYNDSGETLARYQFDILQIMRQFTNLKRIDFAGSFFESLELVEFLTSSASRDRLVEVNSSSYKQSSGWGNYNWPDIFIARENSASQASRLKLEKLSLKNVFYLMKEDIFLDPGIIDMIIPSSLTALVLDKVAAPSDYLLSLITNCNQLQQLQFSFMKCCPCEKRPCVHLDSSKQILDAIPEMESLDSLKIDLINQSGSSDRAYLDIKDDLPILIDRLGRRGRLMEFGLLDNYYCSDHVITGIAHHLTGLKSLELLFTFNFRPAPVLVNMIKKMVNLEKLGFRSAIIVGSYGLITSDVLTAVVTYLRNLKSFHLCLPLHIDRLHLLTRLEHLEELFVSSTYLRNPAYESAFAQATWESAFGHHLQSLELRNCHEEFVAAFLQQVPGVRRLVLSGTIPEKDKILRMIPTACPGLRELHMIPPIGFCDDDIKDSVQTIIDGCPEFENLRY